MSGEEAAAEAGDAVPNGNAPSHDTPPNQTLYVHNLNEKVKIDELKKSLYAIFSQAGQIMEVIASKSWRLRGQAWVVFKEIGSATKALRDLQNFPFHGKPLHIEYARDKSDVVAELEGKKVDKEKRKAEKRKRQEQVDAERERRKRQKKTESTQGDVAAADTAVAAEAVRAVPKPRNEPPNHILFVENLPEQANQAVLSALFGQYPGFTEVNMVPGRSGIAFIVFENEMLAEVAMSGLQHFKIHGDMMMVISFAKKTE